MTGRWCRTPWLRSLCLPSVVLHLGCILSHGGLAAWMHGACRQYLPFTVPLAISTLVSRSLSARALQESVWTGPLVWEHLNREPKDYNISPSRLVLSHLILIFAVSPLLLSLPPSKRDAVKLNHLPSKRPALISQSCAEDRRSDLPRSPKPAALIGRYPTQERRGYETLAVKGQGSQDRSNSNAAGISISRQQSHLLERRQEQAQTRYVWDVPPSCLFQLSRPSLASLLEERWKNMIDELQQPNNPGKWRLIRFRVLTATTELSSTVPCESPPHRWVLAYSSRPVRKYHRKATASPGLALLTDTSLQTRFIFKFGLTTDEGELQNPN